MKKSLSYSFLNTCLSRSFRIKALRDDIVVLQKGLTTEIQQRQEAGQAFQSQIDDRAITTQESFNKNTKDRMSHIVPTLEQLTARFVPLGMLYHFTMHSSLPLLYRA